MSEMLWIIFGAAVGGLIYWLGRLHAWDMAQYHYYNDLPPFDHAKNTDLRAYYRWKEDQNGGKEYAEKRNEDDQQKGRSNEADQ